jgi:YgiT-type zinc finger domain-containing protein
VDKGLQKKEESMKCVYCQGKMKKGTIPFHIDRKGIHVTFDSVPAMVCQQCGQAMFGETEARTIDKVIADLDKNSRKLAKAA